MKYYKKRNKLFYYILFGLIILCLLYFWITVYGNPIIENFTNVSYYNWWGRDSKPTNKERETINKILSFLPNDQSVHLYSVFGDEPNSSPDSQNGVYRIQISGESYYHDPNKFHLNLIPEIEYPNTNIIGFPYAFFHLLHTDVDIGTLTRPRNITIDEIKNKKFCLFAVSNGNAKERVEFFNQLSNYKKVDSCGKFMNNLGYNCPNNHESKDYQEFISQYKFMICFENTSSPNYFTEKLINAYVNGTIPIYWGCPNLDNYVNMSSILYLPPQYTDQDVSNLIERIKELDQDNEAYRSYYNSVFFKDGKIPDSFNLEIIQNKMANILNKPTKK